MSDLSDERQLYFSEVISGGLGMDPPGSVGSELSCALPSESALGMLSR